MKYMQRVWRHKASAVTLPDAALRKRRRPTPGAAYALRG